MDAAGSVPHVLVIGQMGAGKTTVGRLVAERLGRPLRDNDAALEAATGRTAAEIQDAEGRAALHAVERDVVAVLLAEPGPAVVTAPASVVDAPDGAGLGDRALVVWLRASPDVLARRAAAGAHRPLPDHERRALFERLAAERDDRFAAAADLVVDVDQLDPDQAASAVLDALDVA